MLKIRTSSDYDECRMLWERSWPKKCVFDLWEVRDCFARAFNRPRRFHVAELDGKPAGLLPLSVIEEESFLGFYPGETWRGKTWLEQNKIPAINRSVRSELLASVSGCVNLGYLKSEYITGDVSHVEVDEVGYVFQPRQYGYSFDSFLEQFSKKSRKKYALEGSRFENLKMAYRHDHLSDVSWLFRMNKKVFGDSSYFSDPRFLSSFENLAAWLWDKGMLSITTIIIGGSLAAVDIGAVWGRSYTVLAGATNPDFKGVAKVINFHHLERSCNERFEIVDFLCGDFGWKERFHLTPRPLYRILAGSDHEYVPERPYAAMDASLAQ